MVFLPFKPLVGLLLAVLSSGSITGSYLQQDHSSVKECLIDRSQPPKLAELLRCTNSSMFEVWRPKARIIAPRGWMNDPMGIFETTNGTFHIGYQCNPNSLVWSNISQCSASTTDFVHFRDYHSWKNPVTISPSQLYDIRGVFDGSVIKNGWNGHPTIIYTSVFTGPLSARSDPPEIEGVETQSLAYTPDEGSTWIKLNFGAEGNPVIYKWPEQHLSGFRDPFVFESQELSNFYANQSVPHRIPGHIKAPKPSGKKFLLLSGGIRTEADPVNGGPRLFLYQQTDEHDIRDWTYLGPLMPQLAERNQTSEWGGAHGINFECGAITKINEDGVVNEEYPSRSSTQLNVITTGTEGGRDQRNYWPIWKAFSWDFSGPEGNAKANTDFSGVLDWGTAYAFNLFQWKNRQLIVGWIYEDDPLNVLTPQRGAQGAFTLFRELFVKVVRDIHPDKFASPINLPSWKIELQPDGSHHLVTLGQRILPEITSAFRTKSSTHQLSNRAVNPGINPDSTDGQLATNVIPFDKQPNDRYYAITARLDFYAQRIPTGENQGIDRAVMPRGGFRILSSENEWTDVYYDPSEEYLVVDRSHSSVISSYGNSTERAKLRLWSILDPVTRETRMESLNLTIIVDNSVLEVHANEQAIISTRVYPWYKNSTGAAFFAQGRPTIIEDVHPARNPPFSVNRNRVNLPEKVSFQPLSVSFSSVELWDGLLNAWPNRPRDTSLPGVYSHNITSTLYGVWPDL